MATTAEICNLAISHLASGKEISNLDTDRSQEAEVCRRFYTLARDTTLSAFAWPFASSIAALQLVEADPTDEWSYSYRYPTDCLKIRRILSGVRNDTRQSRVPYKIGRDATGLLVYCDLESAEMEYTIKETEASRFPDEFVMALSFRLAALIAPRLTSGDPFGLGKRAIGFYEYEISRAQASALNEEQVEEDPDSEFIRART